LPRTAFRRNDSAAGNHERLRSRCYDMQEAVSEAYKVRPRESWNQHDRMPTLRQSWMSNTCSAGLIRKPFKSSIYDDPSLTRSHTLTTCRYCTASGRSRILAISTKLLWIPQIRLSFMSKHKRYKFASSPGLMDVYLVTS
jgi:hypothetical protein